MKKSHSSQKDFSVSAGDTAPAILDQISLLSKISKERNISILGMQKCGSGTISTYAKFFGNLYWSDHGTFWNEDDAKACYTYCSSKHSLHLLFLKRGFRYQEGFINVAIIRNPYDLLLSAYFHQQWGANEVGKIYDTDGSTVEGFKKFIYGLKNDQEFCFPPFLLSAFYPYYSSEGKFIPDFAIKLEFLQDIIDHRNEPVPTGEGGSLRPWEWRHHESVRHRSNRPKKKNIDLYDEEMISIVQEVFKYELETFGYDMGGLVDNKAFIQKSDIKHLPEEKLRLFNRLIAKRPGGYKQIDYYQLKKI